MMTSQSFVSIRDVSKHFGPVRAVHDVSFDIASGEFFSLLGPSGCGKTTLLRMLAGFEMPTAGELLIDGQPMAAVPSYRRPTNMVFQNYAIFPHLDVRANIAFGLRKQRLSRRETDLVVEQALEMIKLPGYGSRRADQLSGGQRQRVALARCLVRKPKVLLLDEPLGALDKKLREEMQFELRQIQKTVGITFVLVTHDQEEALTMSDRVAVMSKGKVLQIDHPTRLYETPNCREVAEFIGTMNFFDASVTRVENGRAVVDAGPAGTLWVGLGDQRVDTQARVTVAIRPEKVQIGQDRPNQPHNVIAGRVTAEAYLGGRSQCHVEVPGLPKPVAVAYQNMVRCLDSARDQCRPVWLSWPADSAILLPAE